METILDKRYRLSIKKIKELFNTCRKGAFGQKVHLVPFVIEAGEVNYDSFKLVFDIYGYKDCFAFIDFSLKDCDKNFLFYYCKRSILKTEDECVEFDDFYFNELYEICKKFFVDSSPYISSDRKVPCVTRMTGNGSFYAKPLTFIDSSQDLINKFLEDPTSNENKCLLLKPCDKEYNFEKDKYGKYRSDDGEYSVKDMEFKTRCEYYIDRQTELYYFFNILVYKNGYKFSGDKDLKRHLYLSAKKDLNDKYTDDEIRYCISYFMQKSHSKFNEKRNRFMYKAFCNLDKWTHFCTFTYDSRLHDEKSYEKFLKTWFNHQKQEYGILVHGAFERSPEGRLHFHCLMSLSSLFVQKLNLNIEEYYDKDRGEIRRSPISQLLRENIGRCEFIQLDPNSPDFEKIIFYTVKYASKDTRTIYSSRGLSSVIYGEVPNFTKHAIGPYSKNSDFCIMDDSAVIIRS